MSFKSENSNINTILSRNYSYVIPLNQRKYVWGVSEWNELFEDLFLIEQRDDYAHFLGSLVFSKVKGKNSYEVIDGQQRLITISVLLCCIINQLYKCSEEKTANSIKNIYLRGVEDGEDYFKISREDGNLFLIQLIDFIDKYRTNEEITEEYNNNFSKSDKYNEKFLQCYIFFEKKILDFIQLRKKKTKDTLIFFKKRLIDSEIIEISVDDEQDGFRIFETLNARGIPLEQHELLKNFIYSYMRTAAKQQKVSNSWEKITDNLIKNDTDSMSKFLSHYCTHIYGNVKKNEEFKTIRENTKKDHVQELLNELVEDSEYYKYIDNPTSYKNILNYSEIIYDSLMFFKDFNIRQVRPLLISLFEKNHRGQLELKQTENIFSLLETFYFLYVVVSKGKTNFTDNTVNNLAKEIHAASEYDYGKIKIELEKYINQKEVLINSFSILGYSNKNKKFKNSSNKKMANYILKKIEKSYDVQNELNIKISSIEHIMSDSCDEDYTSYIGNLLPLSTKSNNKLSNKPFVEKMKKYKLSNSLSVKKFIENYGDNDCWNENDIIKRTKKIAEYAINVVWIF